MNRSHRPVALALLGLAAACASMETQPQKPKPSADASGPPPMPEIKPAPEHAWLKRFVGTWDAKSSAVYQPGGQPEVADGTMTARLTGGNLWLITDFTSTMMGQPFLGHGVTGYDPIAKKYIVTWVDSMCTSFCTGEGSIDSNAGRSETTITGRDPSGQTMTWRQVEQWINSDTCVMRMYAKAPDGVEFETFTITYTRHR